MTFLVTRHQRLSSRQNNRKKRQRSVDVSTRQQVSTDLLTFEIEDRDPASTTKTTRQQRTLTQTIDNVNNDTEQIISLRRAKINCAKKQVPTTRTEKTLQK